MLTVAVADPSIIIRSGIISVLKRFNLSNIQILEVAEMSRLTYLLKKQKSDILIVNPSLLGVFSLSQIKTESGCNHLKCIALQASIIDRSVLKSYDEVLSIYDTPDQIREKLLSVTQGVEPVRNESTNALSTREKEIIACVVKGLTNKQIAESLYLSTHTVMTHRRNIAAKLQIHSVAGLTIYAIVNKLVELDDIRNIITPESSEV